MAGRIDQREQFSKRLAKWSSIFWFFYMTALAVAMVLEPEVADAVVYISITTSLVMIVNVFAYTRNSTYEKALNALVSLEKTKLTWKSGKSDSGDSSCEADETYETEEEGGSNG